MIADRPTSTATATSDNWGILPEAGYSPDQKLNGGVKFTGRDLGPHDLTLDMELNAAMGKQLGLDASFLAPKVMGGRAINLDEYHYYLSPDKAFFGLGNNHVTSPLSVHSIQRQRALATLAFHAARNLLLAVSAGPRQTKIAPTAPPQSVPSTLTAFPGLAGISGGRTNPLILSFVYNDRVSVTRPTEGLSAIGAVEHVNQNLANDFHFTRFTLAASYLFPLTRDQVLGFNVSGETIEGHSRAIPFFELASLGGANDMRGFFPDRFLGRSSIVFNAEYRAKLAAFPFRHLWDVQIDGVLFSDVGRVFITGSDDSREFRIAEKSLPGLFDEFRYSYGTGLRIALGEAILARLDVGFSNEQTGLVYLVFGHTF